MLNLSSVPDRVTRTKAGGMQIGNLHRVCAATPRPLVAEEIHTVAGGRRMGDELAASIAHELRQPLSAMAISAAAGLRFLEGSPSNVDRAREAFSRIVADGKRAGALIEDICSNFRNLARTNTLLSVNELIEGAIAINRDEMEKHQIRVEIERARQLPEVRGNRIQLQQVLVNLIANAIDAMAVEGEPRILHVKAESYGGDKVVVAVSDTGTGVGSCVVDRIFDPLFTTKPDGMGMGLWICRAIVEAHHGRLWVAPNAPKGTVFRFTLRATGSIQSE